MFRFVEGECVRRDKRQETRDRQEAERNMQEGQTLDARREEEAGIGLKIHLWRREKSDKRQETRDRKEGEKIFSEIYEACLRFLISLLIFVSSSLVFFFSSLVSCFLSRVSFYRGFHEYPCHWFRRS